MTERTFADAANGEQGAEEMKRPSTSPHFATFDGMCWPMPSEHVADIEHKMRHVPAEVNQGDMMLAAEVLQAYRELVFCSSRKRAVVIRGIRARKDELLSGSR